MRKSFWPFADVQNRNGHEVTDKRGVKDIYLPGLALDYFVKYNTLDARHPGLTCTSSLMVAAALNDV